MEIWPKVQIFTLIMGKPLNYFMKSTKLITVVGFGRLLWLENKKSLEKISPAEKIPVRRFVILLVIDNGDLVLSYNDKYEE